MISTEVYFAIVLAITIYSYVKNYNILGKLLWTLYSAISLFTVIAVRNGVVEVDGISIFPYLFLILSFVVFFYPFMKNENIFSAKKIEFTIDNRYIWILIIYTICSIVAIKCLLPSVLSLLSSGNWALNRRELYAGNIVFPYSNRFEYYSIQVSGYFRLLAMIIAFGLLRENRLKILAFAGLGSSVISMILNSIYTSSRGSIVNALMLVLALYLYYYSEIEKDKRRFIFIIASLVMTQIIPYIVEVTVSRFSSGGAGSSVISYLGQAPAVFNTGVSHISKLSFGKYAFGVLFGDNNFSQTNIGGTWGAGFYTFVGWIYIDWGPIGTVIWGMVIGYIITYIINKSKYMISDVFAIFCVYSMLLQGVFVIGRNYSYNIVANIFIYFIIKIFFEKYKFVFGSYGKHRIPEDR